MQHSINNERNLERLVKLGRVFRDELNALLKVMETFKTRDQKINFRLVIRFKIEDKMSDIFIR